MMPSPAWRPTMPPASMIALIGGADEATRELEELRAGQATRQGRRAVEIGGQNRHLVTVGRLQHPHPFEVRQICHRGGDRELRHPDHRFGELADAREATITVVDSNEDLRGSNLDTGVGHHAESGQGDGKFLRLQLVDQVRELGMNDSTKLVATSRCARQNIGTERPESRSPELQWSSKVRDAEVHCLRTEMMRPDREGGGVSRISDGQSPLVGLKHDPPLRVHQGPKVARIVKGRRPRSQPRIVRQRKRTHGPRHARTECPLWSDLAAWT
jgi:hypothetical protein